MPFISVTNPSLQSSQAPCSASVCSRWQHPTSPRSRASWAPRKGSRGGHWGSLDRAGNTAVCMDPATPTPRLWRYIWARKGRNTPRRLHPTRPPPRGSLAASHLGRQGSGRAAGRGASGLPEPTVPGREGLERCSDRPQRSRTRPGRAQVICTLPFLQQVTGKAPASILVKTYL